MHVASVYTLLMASEAVYLFIYLCYILLEHLLKLFSLIFKFHFILLLKLCYWQINLRINNYVLLSVLIVSSACFPYICPLMVFCYQYSSAWRCDTVDYIEFISRHFVFLEVILYREFVISFKSSIATIWINSLLFVD